MPDWLLAVAAVLVVVLLARWLLRMVWRLRLLLGAALLVAVAVAYGPPLPS